MSTLANQIEAYLKQLLAEHSGVIELRRSDLAETFMCVPSQINYVLETRFNESHGYVVESRRGGGGYIRIVRLSLTEGEGLSELLSQNNRRVAQEPGNALIRRLVEEEFLTPREGKIVLALTDNAVLQNGTDLESLRGALLNALLVNLLREDFE